MWSFYKGGPDAINFNNFWHGSQTYLDKVKVKPRISVSYTSRLNYRSDLLFRVVYIGM